MAAAKTKQRSKPAQTWKPDAKTRKKNYIILAILTVWIIFFYFVALIKMTTLS